MMELFFPFLGHFQNLGSEFDDKGITNAREDINRNIIEIELMSTRIASLSALDETNLRVFEISVK
ncbi:hypothetical protein LVD15_23385 [Fulvivirga maritima]|uniref:hypothetical protein n=1 Tax=Fulvivirga maritima TaxID=2904247 RepID=UPI001F250818|nr:hypothetical protein [Fulvivirga maritima]UII26211.1 hypothetical protein LVD15_23385 [Fulvivirga maritima]